MLLCRLGQCRGRRPFAGIDDHARAESGAGHLDPVCHAQAVWTCYRRRRGDGARIFLHSVGATLYSRRRQPGDAVPIEILAVDVKAAMASWGTCRAGPASPQARLLGLRRTWTPREPRTVLRHLRLLVFQPVESRATLGHGRSNADHQTAAAATERFESSSANLPKFLSPISGASGGGQLTRGAAPRFH